MVQGWILNPAIKNTSCQGSIVRAYFNLQPSRLTANPEPTPAGANSPQDSTPTFFPILGSLRLFTSPSQDSRIFDIPTFNIRNRLAQTLDSLNTPLSSHGYQQPPSVVYGV